MTPLALTGEWHHYGTTMERVAVAKLRAYIANQNLSIRKWCERAQLDHGEVSRLLSGHRGSFIRKETADKIARATGGYVRADEWAQA